MQRPNARRPAAITLTKITKDDKADCNDDVPNQEKNSSMENSNRLNHGNDSPTSPDSPLRRKRNPTFITQKKVSDVEQAFA